MDGQNFNNEQNTQPVQDNGFSQEVSQENNYYQDNTNSNPYQTTGYDVQVEEPAKSTDPLAIVSLVLGIIGIVLACCDGIGIVFGIAGLICAIIAQMRGKSGVGTAGLICSIIALVIAVIFIILMIIGFAAIGSDPELYNQILENM
ncbi:MAG: DUF4190 domain-containing protein [Lachnospiraceae bacterium]|nr:DUF4190 domain-containing protein [Lachnospiraceae bacterium]